MSQTARPATTDGTAAAGGRAGKRLNKTDSLGPGDRKSWEAAAAALAPFLDESKDFRVDRMTFSKPETSAHSYTPQMDSVRPKSTGWKFGRSARFSGKTKKIGGGMPFLSRHHMAESLCASSPGPLAYDVESKGFPNRPRAPTQFWGSLTENVNHLLALIF
jgi:hypothetical protein